MNVSNMISTRKTATRQAGLAITDTSFGVVQGQIFKHSVPFTLPCAVYLYERGSMQMIQKTMTDSNGHYQFTDLNLGFKWVIAAVDPARQYNAVIQDGLVAI